VQIYVIALVLASILLVPFWETIIALGGVTIVYCLKGGLKAIVYSEVAQMIIKVLGIFHDHVLPPCTTWVAGARSSSTWIHRRLAGPSTSTTWASMAANMVFGRCCSAASFYIRLITARIRRQAQRILAARDEHTSQAPAAVQRAAAVSNYAGVLYRRADFLGAFAWRILSSVRPFPSITGSVDSCLYRQLPSAWGRRDYCGRADSRVDVFVQLDVEFAHGGDNGGFRRSVGGNTDGAIRECSKYVFAGLGRGDTHCGIFLRASWQLRAIEAINKIGSVSYGPILGIFLLTTLPRVTPASPPTWPRLRVWA